MNTQVNQINQKLYLPLGLASQIKAEADKNKAFSAICTHFAMRERSRSQITLASLYKSMSKEGFQFDKGEYARALRFLSAIGIAEIDLDLKGRLRSIKGVNVALQTIATAALDQNSAIQTPDLPKPKVPAANKLKPKGTPATLTLSIFGREFTRELPLQEAMKHIMELLEEQQQQIKEKTA